MRDRFRQCRRFKCTVCLPRASNWRHSTSVAIYYDRRNPCVCIMRTACLGRLGGRYETGWWLRVHYVCTRTKGVKSVYLTGLWGSPLQNGFFLGGFVLKCTHQTQGLLVNIVVYICNDGPPWLLVLGGHCMCTCWYMVGVQPYIAPIMVSWYSLMVKGTNCNLNLLQTNMCTYWWTRRSNQRDKCKYCWNDECYSVVKFLHLLCCGIICGVICIPWGSQGSCPVVQESVVCESILTPPSGGWLLLVGSLGVSWWTPKQLFGGHFCGCVLIVWSGRLLVSLGHIFWCRPDGPQTYLLNAVVFVQHIAFHILYMW